MSDELNRSRRRLILLAALFMGPLILAWLLYFAGWRPVGNVEHGELITPPVALNEILPGYVQGDAPGGLFRRSWTLGVVAAEGCDARCEEVLIKIRQIRLTLGKDMDRIARVLIAPADGVDAERLAEQHSGLIVADAGSDGMVELLRQFPGGDTTAGWIYLVDPLGNLMMRYAVDAGSHGIREDLKRLLRLSRSG